MAIFHLSAKVVSRGAGQSAVAKAAYNSRTKLEDERTGETKDHSRRSGLVFSGIFAPKDAPEWASDRQQLWNEVERREDASNRASSAQLAREIQIGLPHELTDQQREWLIKDFVREQIVSKGMVADVNIHQPGGEGDNRNHHAHILVTMREIGPEGFGPKVREWNSRGQVEEWREKWEHMANKHLERHGHDARIDRRTLEAQGIEREPTTHRGPHVDAIERRGVEADNTRQNEDRRAELAELRASLSNITRDIAAERNEMSAAANDDGIEARKQRAEALKVHFEKLLTDPEYRHAYEKQQSELEARKTLRQLREADRDHIPDGATRGGMEAQQDAANDYARRIVQHETTRKLVEDFRDTNTEMTDAAQSGQETKERQRETRDRREKNDKEQVFQRIESVTGQNLRR